MQQVNWIGSKTDGPGGRRSCAARSLIASVASALCLCVTHVASAAAQTTSEPKPEQIDMQAAMEAARKYTQPGDAHRVLARFLGAWDTEARMTMVGATTAAEKGVVTVDWLIEGRWLRSQMTGTIMGMPMQSHFTMGYDNFKKSYVTAAVSSMDTALNTSEGDLDPSGKALITYGTVDEYLTGEHDKMVKYVWRFLSDDKIALEVHDLPIGEHNTKVLEFMMTRRKAKT